MLTNKSTDSILGCYGDESFLLFHFQVSLPLALLEILDPCHRYGKSQLRQGPAVNKKARNHHLAACSEDQSREGR